MGKSQTKYFGIKINVICAQNVNNVKYKYKLDKKYFCFCLIPSCLFLLNFVSIVNIIMQVVKIV